MSEVRILSPRPDVKSPRRFSFEIARGGCFSRVFRLREQNRSKRRRNCSYCLRVAANRMSATRRCRSTASTSDPRTGRRSSSPATAAAASWSAPSAPRGPRRRAPTSRLASASSCPCCRRSTSNSFAIRVAPRSGLEAVKQQRATESARCDNRSTLVSCSGQLLRRARGSADTRQARANDRQLAAESRVLVRQPLHLLVQ